MGLGRKGKGRVGRGRGWSGMEKRGRGGAFEKS